MSFLGNIAKAALPAAATVLGGPVAGAAASAVFGGGKAKGGAEGVGQLMSMFGAGGGKPAGLQGMVPDLAKQALSLFKDATTNEQKNKLLDLAIFALGGDPAQKAGGKGGMTSLSSPNSPMATLASPANDSGKATHAPKAKARSDETTKVETTKVTYEQGDTKITYEHTGGAKADKAGSTGRTSSTTASAGAGGELSVKGNTVDTGRYEISASTKDGGTVKVLDKQTNTFVEAFGDPHVRTSDGDKAQFHKNGLSIKLPDGTNVHMKPTQTDSKGMAYIDSAMVEKDGKAVTMDGLHSPQMKTSEAKTANDEMRADYTTQGQTVLDASEQDVGDLFMTGPDGQRTKELVSPDKELNLDGMGGALNTVDGKPADSNGSQFRINSEQLEKLSQVLHLTAKNAPDIATQKDLLQNIQGVLATFLTPKMNEAA